MIDDCNLGKSSRVSERHRLYSSRESDPEAKRGSGNDEQITAFEAQAAKAVVFVAPDDSSYVTGIELFVDGGAGQI